MALSVHCLNLVQLAPISCLCVCVFVSDSSRRGALQSNLCQQFALLDSVDNSFDKVVTSHQLVVHCPRFSECVDCECWLGPCESL